MNEYSVEQKRTFGRVARFIELVSIADMTWQDVALDEDGSFLEWPPQFPDDFEASDLVPLLSDEDAEDKYEEVALDANLVRDKDPILIMISELINELPQGRRVAVKQNVVARAKARRQRQ